MSNYKWIVHPHSYAERGSRQVSVIHEANFHGLKSYGWFDDLKILITRDSMSGALNDEVVEKAIVIAQEMADKLNLDSSFPSVEYIKKLEDDRDREAAHFSKMLDVIYDRIDDGVMSAILDGGTNNER